MLGREGLARRRHRPTEPRPEPTGPPGRPLAIALTPSPGRRRTQESSRGQGQDCGGPRPLPAHLLLQAPCPPHPCAASQQALTGSRRPSGRQLTVSLLSTGHTALGVGSHHYLCILNPFFSVTLSLPCPPISIFKKPIYLKLFSVSSLQHRDPVFNFFCAPCLMRLTHDI